ncbi:sensor histidine kinase [Aureispira anguillae]|uniref:Sensor histidine kinase n=1 Tax=Aureispira anguillae TaxID=2864201 RepID=A0A916DRF0_9BACT|nr:sensor histidine kinase [Aureispira anguillae]BDS11241.1 sensor histidine kinase [Aureispira anguillae]
MSLRTKIITKENGKELTYLKHLILWLLLFVAPIFLLENIGLIFTYAPVYYIAAFLVLIVVFYAFYLKFTPQYLLNDRIFIYLGLIVVCFMIYRHFPKVVCRLLPEHPWTQDPFGLEEELKAKMRLGALFMYFVITLVISIIESLKDAQQLNQRLKSEKNIAELALLKSQVNPHFLFNSLNSIYYLAIKKADEAPKAIIALSDMMRYVFTEASNDSVPLLREIDYITKYIDLQRLRLPKHTEVKSEISVQEETLMIAPLLLIPFIENAFKYGVSTRKATTIYLQITADADQLSMKVLNTIIATEQEEIETKTGTGIDNVKRQLELIYPNRHTLSINNDGNVFEVKLKINNQKNNGK